MGEKSMVPAPTNVGERVKRTVLQVGVPAFLLLVVVLPPVLDVVDSEVGEYLPPGFRAWMLGAAALLTAIAGAAARVMALPVVNDWLSRWTPFGTAHPKVAKRLDGDG